MNEGIVVEVKTPTTEIEMRIFFYLSSSVEFAKSYEEFGPASLIFFILSPGVDPSAKQNCPLNHIQSSDLKQ